MPRANQVRCLIALAAFCLVVAAGCSGQKAVTVKGTVAGEASWKLGKDDSVQVTFDPQTSDDRPAQAQASHSDGSFSLQLTPGKYKVAVQVTPYPGAPDSEKRARQFEQYNNKYRAGNTPLTCEVTSASEQTITIDLGKGTITRK